METHFDDENDVNLPLTKEEKAAIASLQRLAKKWPKTLWLYSASGTLCVMKKDADGNHAYRIGADGDDAVDPRYEVEEIAIENDGGDW